MLEVEAIFYLQALYNSEPIGRDESPDMYLTRGVIQGMCGVFGACFKVELRRKVIFYKGSFPGEGKFWFEVVNENITEEEAKHK